MAKSVDHIAITGMGSISPMGYSPDEVWQSYLRRQSLLRPRIFNGEKVAVASLQKPSEDIVKSIRLEEAYHKHLDRTVLMAMHCAREAAEQAGWERADSGPRTGVNIGSSRGATGILEEFHTAYVRSPSQRLDPLTSPTTTLGNISSTVAHDIGANGPELSHSVTCSSGLHAIFNGIAWMRAGLADRFLVGGAEAPLTGFTVAQMKALRIYTNETNSEFPSRPCASEAPLHDTLALGEGGAIFAIEKLTGAQIKEKKQTVLGVIEGFGYGIESPGTATSVTEDGLALRNAMTMALKSLPSGDAVDMIILHAPGTIKGDRSELNAIKIVFGGKLPVLLSNKWFIGHTFGASAALSLEYALLILAGDDYIDFPYPVMFENQRRPVRRIMINAAGFGGNAASLIVSKPLK